ncbi:MAG: cupin domain-containing protein [Planctomycetes bacterium]|nr:cupin domain-containing protein [Planctomycetota bacterium]
MSVLDVGYCRENQRGIYVIRMEPGAVTIPHTHGCWEEYLILEGELIESDGTVLKKGDLTSYHPGSHHNSRTETGCLLIGFDWDRPAPPRQD